MSRPRTNKENRPKRPSTLGLLLGGTGGRKDASKGGRPSGRGAAGSATARARWPPTLLALI